MVELYHHSPICLHGIVLNFSVLEGRDGDVLKYIPRNSLELLWKTTDIYSAKIAGI
jgi:hypothetical protein